MIMNTTIVKSKGFSLVEVLIAVFIFAVGLLGIAGLQMAAKQNSFDSVQRTSAALLASEIAEKMRVNSTNAAAYISSANDLATATLPTADCSNGAACDGATLAEFDRKIWYQAILGQSKVNTTTAAAAGGLVSPSACITADGTGYDIAIAWRGKLAMSNPASSACGQGTGLYGTNDEFRRVLVFKIAV